MNNSDLVLLIKFYRNKYDSLNSSQIIHPEVQYKQVQFHIITQAMIRIIVDEEIENSPAQYTLVQLMFESFNYQVNEGSELANC